MEVADICCEGRVVSVLEGGYGRTSTSENFDSASFSQNTDFNNGNNLDKSIFSGCAIRHLRAMIDPFDVERLH
jgi:acetoin utilization deacetylase AcuC-like enzyme